MSGKVRWMCDALGRVELIARTRLVRAWLIFVGGYVEVTQLARGRWL